MIKPTNGLTFEKIRYGAYQRVRTESNHPYTFSSENVVVLIYYVTIPHLRNTAIKVKTVTHTQIYSRIVPLSALVYDRACTNIRFPDE